MELNLLLNSQYKKSSIGKRNNGFLKSKANCISFSPGRSHLLKQNCPEKRIINIGQQIVFINYF